MYLIRLLIIGDTGVGKTSLLIRFNENSFVKNQKTTIGVDYKAKEMTVNGELVKLQIWDTAGQERFRSMTAAFYNRAQGVLLTFDVSQRDSFMNIPSWVRDVKKDAPSSCVIFLCANKVDIDPSLWRVKREEYELFARENNFPLFEASASTGCNVQDMFLKLASVILTKCRDDLAVLRTDSQRDAVILFDVPKEQIKKEKSNCC